MHHLVTRIDRRSSLSHEATHRSHGLCAVLRSSVESLDWLLHTQSKQGINNDVPNVIESQSYSLSVIETHSLHIK